LYLYLFLTQIIVKSFKKFNGIYFALIPFENTTYKNLRLPCTKIWVIFYLGIPLILILALYK